MKRSIVILMMAFFVSCMLAGTSGKLTGIVLDENGDPLAGANVVVDGQTWGAETDGDGYYYILGVRAGKYTIRCQFVGYAPQMVNNVQVRVGMTKKQNFKMVPADVQVETMEIEVSMDEKVDKDVTTSVRAIDMGNLEKQAVSEVADVIAGQAGVQKDANGELNFRGGRSGEVNYVIDGVSVSDPTGAKGSPVGINFANVESFDIQKGVPSAEFGDALSGSVNIVYKVGDQEKTSGQVKYATDFFFGDSKLDYHKGEFNLNGPMPFTKSWKRRPTYYIGTDLTTQNGYSQSYRVNGDPDGDYYEFPDYDLTDFGFKMPQKRQNNYNIILKTAYDLTDKMNLQTSFTRSRTHNFGGYWSLQYMREYDYSYANWYSPETVNESDETVTTFNATLKHNIDQQSYYQLIFAYYNRQYELLPGGKKPDEYIFDGDQDSFDNGIHGIINNGSIRDGGDAEGYTDVNRNGYFDREYFVDERKVDSEGVLERDYNGNWDFGEVYIDANLNGKYDGDELFDSDGDNRWDYWDLGRDFSGFPYTKIGTDVVAGYIDDAGKEQSDIYDSEIVEGYQDTNLSGHYEPDLYNIVGDEPYTDGDGYFDTGEPFIDQVRYSEVQSALVYRADGQLSEAITGNFNKIRMEAVYIGFGITSESTEADSLAAVAEFEEKIALYGGSVSYNVFDSGAGDKEYASVIYPKETFLDLESSQGNLDQSNPRINLAHDPANGMFDEYEAYTSFRSWGANIDVTKLGEVKEGDAGYDPAVKEWRGSYVTYRAPRMVSVAGVEKPVGQVALGEITPNAYSTWTDNNNNEKFDRANTEYDVGESFVDYNHDGNRNETNGFLNPGTYGNLVYSKQDNTVMKVKADYTNQINNNHMIKTGLTLVFNDLDYYVMDGVNIENDGDYAVEDDDPYPDRGRSKTDYRYKPFELAYYVTDKMEFDDLVINAGVRFDMRRHDDAAVDYYEQQQATESNLGYQEDLDRYEFAVSPRFGISHSISETSKLFFSYGHLYQNPTYTYIYKPHTQGGVTYGSMNLGYERNVQYELGVVNEFGDYLVDVTGYFKDNYDGLNTERHEQGIFVEDTFTNSDYGKSRGVELTVDKSLSDYYTWNLSYTLGYAYGKSSDATSNATDAATGEEKEIKEFPLRWDERHALSFSITTIFGKGERLFESIPFTDDWSLNATTDYGSGKPFTPSRQYYDYKKEADEIEENSERVDWHSNTNLTFSKSFRFTGEDKKSLGMLKLDFNVFNLFNKRNLYDYTSVYSSTGTWTDPGENADGESLLEKYPERAMSFADPTNVTEKRRYKFSVSYNW